jgi:UDP-3-O-[3-hydroxymyristoyl] glucosamine N-acyltransferase
VLGGRRVAESRAVELGASIDALALIAHGIAVGDAVIVDPPVTLKTGSEVEVVP